MAGTGRMPGLDRCRDGFAAARSPDWPVDVLAGAADLREARRDRAAGLVRRRVVMPGCPGWQQDRRPMATVAGSARSAQPTGGRRERRNTALKRQPRVAIKVAAAAPRFWLRHRRWRLRREAGGPCEWGASGSLAEAGPAGHMRCNLPRRW